MNTIFARVQQYWADKKLEEFYALFEDKNVGKTKILEKLNEAIGVDNRHSSQPGWDFSKEKASSLFAAGNGLILRPMKESDARFYCHIHNQWLSMTTSIPEEAYIPYMMEDYNRDNALFCVVSTEADSTDIGYVAIKDTSCDLWELAVELDAPYCGKGFGSAAIQLFLDKVSRLTGKTQFQALVEPDNYICQHCMKKAGAEFAGLYNLSFESETEAAEFTESNLDLITNDIIQLASELHVEPRDLLTHVLEYRIHTI